MSTTPVQNADSDLQRRSKAEEEHSPYTESNTVYEQETTQSQDIPAAIGRLIPRRKVGSGGFGIVYAAYDPQLFREVAVKVPRASFLANDKLIERFLREVQAAGSLDHPNILSIADAGRDGLVPYLVSPLCHGPDLAKWLGELKPARVPVSVAVHWIEQLAHGVNHAHRRGFIHRDIKPSNILLETCGQKDPAQWIPKLTDFGLAKALNEDSSEPLTHSGDTLGTPEYMAPEQIAGQHENIGVATDIHGLGAVLHELLFGCSPYGGQNRTMTLLRILNNPPAFPSGIQSGLPADLRAIVARCLEKKPEDRYATVADLADDLHRFRQGLPTRARPLNWVQRSLRFVRHYPLIASLSFLVLVLLIGFIANIIRYESSLRKSLSEANTARNQAQEQATELSNRIYLSQLQLISGMLAEGKYPQALDELSNIKPARSDMAYRILSRMIWDKPVVYLAGSDIIIKMCTTEDGRHLHYHDGSNQLRCWDLSSGIRKSYVPEIGNVYFPRNRRENGIFCFLTDRQEIGVIDAVRTVPVLKTFPLPKDSPSGFRDGVMAYAPSESLVVIVDSDYGWYLKHPSSSQAKFFPWNVETNNAFVVPTLSPLGRWFIARTGKGIHHIWSLPDGTYQGTLPVINRNPEFQHCFSENDRICHMGFNDGKVYVVDLETRTLLQQQDGLVPGMQSYQLKEYPFQPDCLGANGHSWYVGNQDGEVRYVDLATMKSTLLLKHSSRILLVHLANATQLISADMHELKITDAQTGKILQSWPIPDELKARQGQDYLNEMDYLPELNTVALGHSDGKVALWKLGALPVPEMVHGNSGAFAVAFSPDSRLLASAGANKAVNIWDVSTRTCLRTLKGHSDLIEAMTFSRDGQWLLTGSYDKSVRLWSMRTGECIRVYTGAKSSIRSVVFSPDEKRIYAGTKKISNQDPRAFILGWNVNSGELEQTMQAHTDHVRTLQFPKRGRELYSGSEDHYLKIWDIETGLSLNQFNVGQQVWQLNEIDDQWIIAGDSPFISHWDKATWSLRRKLYDPDTHHRGLAVSLDRETIVTGGEKGPIRFWQTRTGLEMAKIDLGKDGVIHMAVSPDGKYLAAACKSGLVKLYPTE